MKDRLKRTATLTTLVTLTGAIAAFAQPQAAPVRELTCQSTPLAEPLDWISSLEWDQQRQRVLLVDPMADRTLAISADGGVEELLTGNGRSFVGVTRAGNDLLMVARGTKMTVFHRLEVPNAGPLAGAAIAGQSVDVRGHGNNAQEARIIAQQDFRVVGDQIVSYGALQPPGQSPNDRIFGFFTYPLGPGAAGARAELILGLPEEDLYTFGHPSIAGIGDTAYFLALDAYPELYAYDTSGMATPNLLPGLPDENEGLPEIDLFEIDSPAVLLAKIESSEMPIGLYSRPSSAALWYLRRSPHPEGGSDYRFFKLRPEIDRVVTEEILVMPREVGAAHPHLSVAPAAEAFYVLGKGQFSSDNGRWSQDIRTLWRCSE